MAWMQPPNLRRFVSSPEPSTVRMVDGYSVFKIGRAKRAASEKE
jgi:hypothetical protein